MALILVADDDTVLTEVLKDYLESRSHQVCIVHDGVAASIKAQEWKPHVIILDVMMPGAYGTSAYKSLENAGLTKSTPVIFLTALPPEKVRQIIPADVPLLTKPVDYDALSAAVRDALARSGRPA